MLSEKLPSHTMHLRWFFSAIFSSLIVVLNFFVLPSFAQKLPTDLQEQVDHGFLTRKEAELLNSARGQALGSSKGSTSKNGRSKLSPALCSERVNDPDPKPVAHHDAPSKDEIDFNPYMEALKRKIRPYWDASDSDKSQPTVIHFFIYRNGNISNLRVACSSGSQGVDQAAIDAVRQAAPFSALPAAYLGNAIEIDFTFPCPQ
jgi:TonB family protein